MRDEGIEAYPITKPNCVIDEKIGWSRMYKTIPKDQEELFTLSQETEQTY